MPLDSARVEQIFLDALFKDGEDTTNHVPVHGITVNVGFHPGRLEGYRAEVAEMLSELPDEFQKTKGGGWSFLNACNDKHGNQWTSFHQNMEQLFLLGMGLKLVESQMPRDLWHILPGGMPYYVVKDDQEDNT